MNNNPDSSKENSFQGLWPPPSTTNVAGDNETRSPPSENVLGIRRRDDETLRPPLVAGDHERCPRPCPRPPPNVPAADETGSHPRPPPNVPAANETRPHPRPTGASETHEKPNKKQKRTREIIVRGDPVMTTLQLGCNPNMKFIIGTTSKKPKPWKNPDLNAPLIVCPCAECGKTFWSWKALFGHMRCHPERGWRGIIPPEKRQRRQRKRAAAASADPQGSGLGRVDMNQDDQEVATGLLMLANGLLTMDIGTEFDNAHQGSPETVDSAAVAANENHGYECSSCKRVFGSHQALGGHRASHKKVKGCFAIAAENSDDSNNENRNNGDDSNGKAGSNDRGKWKGKAKVTDDQGVVLGHRCGICGKVFATGQALGGHMRCHWDRGDQNSSSSSMVFQPQQQLGGMFNPSTTAGCSTSYANREGSDGTGYALDLNMPPPHEPELELELEPEAAPAPPVDDADHGEDSSSSSTSSSEMDLDLKLGF